MFMFYFQYVYVKVAYYYNLSPCFLKSRKIFSKFFIKRLVVFIYISGWPVYISNSNALYVVWFDTLINCPSHIYDVVSVNIFFIVIDAI